MQYVQPVCPPPAPAPPPLQWTLFGDVMWLRPTGSEVSRAEQQNGIGGAVTSPLERSVADPGFDVGFRVGGELQFEPCAGVFASYAFFDSTDDSHLPAPTIPGGDRAVGSLVHRPGRLTPLSGRSTQRTTFNSNLRMPLIANLLFSTDAKSSRRLRRWSLGNSIRTFLQSGVFSGGLGGAINTTSHIDFTGGGPIIGIDAERRIDSSGFSVYGSRVGRIPARKGPFRLPHVQYNHEHTLS